MFIFEKFVILSGQNGKNGNLVVSLIWLKFCTHNRFCIYNLQMCSSLWTFYDFWKVCNFDCQNGKKGNLVVSLIWLKFCTRNRFCIYNLQIYSILWTFYHFWKVCNFDHKRAKYSSFSDLAEILYPEQFSFVEFENEVQFWTFCNFDP